MVDPPGQAGALQIKERRQADPLEQDDRPGPRNEYARRLARHKARADRQTRRFDRIADGRLVVFVAALVLSGLAYLGWLSWWFLVAPAAAFVALVFWHGRAADKRDHANRASAYYEAALARLEDRWAGQGWRLRRWTWPTTRCGNWGTRKTY